MKVIKKLSIMKKINKIKKKQCKINQNKIS